MPLRGRGGPVKKAQKITGMTVQEAGRKGGQTVKDKYGPEFYSQIGQKGGEKVQAEAKRYRELKKLGKV